MDKLSADIKIDFINFILPINYLPNEILKSYDLIFNIYCYSCSGIAYISSKLQWLNKIYMYSKKYYKYNESYEYCLSKKVCNGHSPILLDMVLSGYSMPVGKYSCSKFSVDEIVEIIDLLPETLLSDMGEVRCREYITPIVAACFNIKCPLYIIEYLINRTIHYFGTKKLHSAISYKLNCGWITIFDDAEYIDRWTEIEKIFKSYYIY